MKLLALVAALGAPWSWDDVPWDSLIHEAGLIVAGEVVDFGKDGKGRKTAVFRVERVLKGGPIDTIMLLPFKTEQTWACDYTIEYEKKKYLLLIDDKHYFRLIYYPSYTQVEISGTDDKALRFTEAVLDVRQGRRGRKQIAALGRFCGDPDYRESVVHLMRHLSRRDVAPILKTIRRAYREVYRERTSGWDLSDPEERVYALMHEAERTLDFRLVPAILECKVPDDPDYPKETARYFRVLTHLLGRAVPTKKAFRKRWETCLARAKERPASVQVPALLEGLGSIDPETRNATQERILDLGLGVLPELRKIPAPKDPEARARLTHIVAELELTADIRRELKTPKDGDSPAPSSSRPQGDDTLPR